MHSLSLDFHLSKMTGEVLSALSKGAAINTFLEQVLFQILPVVVDLALVSPPILSKTTFLSFKSYIDDRPVFTFSFISMHISL